MFIKNDLKGLFIDAVGLKGPQGAKADKANADKANGYRPTKKPDPPD
jgi:hypothetical protein